MSTRELHWRIGDHDASCRIEEVKGSGTFYIFGKTLPFHFLGPNHIEISGKRHRFYVIHNRNSWTVWLDGHTYHLHRATRTSDAQAPTHASTGEIRALMPGKLLRLTVEVGDTVSAKQTLAVMESMKMESSLAAPKSGRVSEIHFKPGDVLDMGEIVMIIESI
jgi:acetyl/propionyl-CoA carboxylase alpha subunit